MLSTLLCVVKTTDEVWNPYRLVSLVIKSLFCMEKKQMRAGTHTDLSFWCKSCCFACKNDRLCLGLIVTCSSGPQGAVLHPKTTGGVLDPQRLVILVLKSLFCMHKTTGEGWNQCSPFILVLSTLLCVLKTRDEIWDSYRLVSLVLKSLFCIEKKHK